MSDFIVKTSINTKHSIPAINAKGRTTYPTKIVSNKLIILKPGIQYSSTTGFSILNITTSGTIQITGSLNNNPNYLVQKINNQAIINDTVDSFIITNPSTSNDTVTITFQSAL